MRCAEEQGASPNRLATIRKARAAVAEVIVWERARDYAAQHDGGLKDGLVQHLYAGFRSDYETDVRYRDLIRALAEVRLLDAAAAQPEAVQQ